MNTIKQKQKNCRRQISKITVQILPKAVTLKKTQFHWPVIPPQQPWPSCRVVVYCCCTFFLKNDFSSRGPDSNVSNELVRRSRDVVRIIDRYSSPALHREDIFGYWTLGPTVSARRTPRFRVPSRLRTRRAVVRPRFRRRIRTTRVRLFD